MATEVDSEEAFAQLLDEKTAAPFELKIVGDGEETFLGHARAGYWEWIYGERESGKLTTYSVGYHSEKPFQIEVEKRRFTVSPRKIRAFLAPSLEQEFGPKDASTPEGLKEEIRKSGKPVAVAEYRLEIGKTYFGLAHTEHMKLPPQGEGRPPSGVKRAVLWISDRPFVEGRPPGELTPVYRGWR